ncbi:hypothetical protein CFAM422_002100 [Trichoderma lentiforme]|uniref:Uncharacterized protein n=1 Tax=Trichoderma lentiforme TaxID=1567552 RepID=A0A9P4XNU1_9HYPO|nr:hypothetical protein CFAM422_002100 [Trichoderma lentiforme]
MLPESPPRACFWGWPGLVSGTRIATEGAVQLQVAFSSSPGRTSPLTQPESLCERWGRGRAHRLSFSSWDFHSFSRRVFARRLSQSARLCPSRLFPIASCVVCSNFRSIRNGSAGLVSLAATASTFAYLSAERLIPTLGNHRSFASACAASIDFPLLAPSSTFA